GHIFAGGFHPPVDLSSNDIRGNIQIMCEHLYRVREALLDGRQPTELPRRLHRGVSDVLFDAPMSPEDFRVLGQHPHLDDLSRVIWDALFSQKRGKYGEIRLVMDQRDFLTRAQLGRKLDPKQAVLVCDDAVARLANGDYDTR